MKDYSIKKIFYLSLTIITVFSLFVSILFSYKEHNRIAKETTLTLLEKLLSDTEERILSSDSNYKRVKELTENAVLAKAKVLARIVKDSNIFYESLISFNNAIASISTMVSELTPEMKKMFYRKAIINSNKFNLCESVISNLAKDLDVEEISIVNKDGIVVLSKPEDNIGFVMASSKQSNEFVNKLINNNILSEYVQKPMINTNNKYFQYVGVKNLNGEGFVQIGYYPKRIQEAYSLADISNISNNYKVGNNGKLKIVKSTDEEFLKELNGSEKVIVNRLVEGSPSICIYKKFLYWIIRVSLPEEEMYSYTNKSLKTMIIFYLILFSVIYILIVILFQILVAKKVS